MYKPMEKVNWGVLPEIPQVCVNNFSMEYINWDTMKAFFMTHIEPDLVRDVLNNEFLMQLLTSPKDSARLYMHEHVLDHLFFWISSDDVPENEKSHLETLLRCLLSLEKLIILHPYVKQRLILSASNEIKSATWVDVMPMFSGHDMGAVMLLLEKVDKNSTGQDKRILYTGHCRLVWKDLLETLKPLFYDVHCVIPKVLDKVYIDTTYCVPEIEELPARQNVTLELIEELYQMMKIPYLRVAFSCAGYLKQSHSRLFECISDKLYPYVQSLPLTTSCTCKNYKIPEENSVEHLEHNSQYVVKIHLSCGQIPGDSAPKEGCNSTPENKKLLWSKDEPSIINTGMLTKQVLYAGNLSRFELGRFVCGLNVRIENVVPLYKPRTSTVEEVCQLIKETCQQVQRQPRFLATEQTGFWYDMAHLCDADFYGTADLSKVTVYRHDRSFRREGPTVASAADAGLTHNHNSSSIHSHSSYISMRST